MCDSCEKQGLITSVITPNTDADKSSALVPLNGPNTLVPQQANSDEQVIQLWLHGRGPNSRRAYSADIIRFLEFVHHKRIGLVTLPDIQAFADSLEQAGLEGSTRHRILASLKSLFNFAMKIGYLRFDVTRPLRLPRFKDTLAERILTEDEIQKIIAGETNQRNRLILRFFFVTGVRVSELCSLNWRDLQKRIEGGQVTVFGKGNRTRVVLIPEPLWSDLITFREDALDTEPVFRSKKGGHLNAGHVLRLVKKAGLSAIHKDTCCHAFRHSHATIAMEHGASITLVQSTLGHASLAVTGRYLHIRPNESSSSYLKV
ncbi:MAG: tyrosine-type recombinase/integrase [Phycisphaerae bacterium]|jgi:integrase/recombinase XerD|nr:tyrosine-type recombinase/integrase [Phycisphaerae bacterium]